MKTFVSIRTKLIINTMFIISLIFLVVLSSITIINIQTVNKGLIKSEQNIRSALIAKGNTLAKNNSIALTGMAEDNAFTAIQALVSSTVNDDPDITYGIYMDEDFFPWASASPENPAGVPQHQTPLNDEHSQWAGSLQELGHKTRVHNDDEIIEFAAPVLIEDEIVGWIRYGISTKSMRDALQEARTDGERTRIQSISVLFSLGVLSLIVSYVIVKRLADKITAPIGSLVESTKTIAQGNYEVPVTSESHDELGLLVKDVDTMRISIKELTENLREQERLEREMELARQIQTSLLPRIVHDIHSDFEISAMMLPAEEVGGDYYDITFDRGGHLWLGIGDVSGHGVTPGLIMMMAQTIHTTIITNAHSSPAEVVNILNAVLYKNVHERLQADHFMTLTLLLYLGAGRFRYAGAHVDLVVYRARKKACECIDTPGVWLNFLPEISHVTNDSELTLEIGDVLVLYTDGLTEVWNKEDDMLDTQGFMNIVATHAEKTAETMRDAILADILDWCQHIKKDDMSLMVVRRII